MKVRVELTVYGRVQGVFYRASTVETARTMSVCGTVKNNSDGSVTIDAEAPTETMERFISWCKEGPRRARVERIEKRELELAGFANFEIIRN